MCVTQPVADVFSAVARAWSKEVCKHAACRQLLVDSFLWASGYASHTSCELYSRFVPRRYISLISVFKPKMVSRDSKAMA